jgi:glycosyltransferase involved in cell wall biosynthesis
MKNPKVSIITPLYNCEKFIAEAINSVIAQTQDDWEMLIIDDCSTDNSRLIVKEFIKMDNRIKYYKTNFPSGSPTTPRNIGIEMANGQFIAFLDSDDLWSPNKLEVQIPLFLDDNVGIVFSNYEKINEKGESNGRFIIAPNKVSYNNLLKGNVIACLTAIYDCKKIGKVYFNRQGHEDYAFWLSILKKGYFAKNSNYILAKYRVRKNSISSDKYKVIAWYYKIYRRNESFSVLRTAYYLVMALSKSFFKYVK